MPIAIEGKGKDNSVGYGLLVSMQRVGLMVQHIHPLLMALRLKVLSWIVKSLLTWQSMIHNPSPS